MSYTLSKESTQEMRDEYKALIKEGKLNYYNATEATHGNSTSEDLPDYYYQLPSAPKHGAFELHNHSIYLFYCLVLPFALMGLTAIVATLLPPHVLHSLPGHGLVKKLRSLLGHPLPPIKFFKWLAGGVTVGEMLLYVWILVPQLWWAVESFTHARSMYNAGKASHVHNLTEFTETQFWLRWTALIFAIRFLTSVPFIFIPVARGSLINDFLGVSASQSLKFHRWIGYHVAISMFMHGFLLQALFIDARVWWTEIGRWDYYHGASNMAGLISWIAAIALFAVTFIRRKSYKVFYYVHVIGAVVVILFVTIHVNFASCYIYGVIVWGIDLVYRFVQSCHTVDITAVKSKGSRIVTLIIPIEEGVKYKDGSHVWINIPAISRFAFHPFSIATSQAHPDWTGHMMLHIAVLNGWTKKLGELVENRTTLQAKIQGPFDGHDISMEEQQDLSSMLFICGGTGITAVSGIIHKLAIQRATHPTGLDNKPLPPCHVVFSCSNALDLQMVAPLLVHHKSIDITIHYTGKKSLSQVSMPVPSPADAKLAQGKVEEDPTHNHRRPSGFIDLDGSSDSGSSDGNESEKEQLPVRRLVPRVTSRWSLAIVWIVGALCALWFMMLPDAQRHQNSVNLLSLGNSNHKGYRIGYPLWNTFLLIVVAVIIPGLLVLCVHLFSRIMRRRSLDEGLDEDSSSDEDKVASFDTRIPMESGQLQAEAADIVSALSHPTALSYTTALPSLPISILDDHSPSELTVCECQHGVGLMLGLSNDQKMSLIVKEGRLDHTAFIESYLATKTDNKPIALWTAGHPAMCKDVYNTVYSEKRWRGLVDLHECTFVM